MAVALAATAGDVATARKELASTGSLRVGVVSAPKANVFFVTQDADGRPHGVTVDLGDELARSLDVASKFFVFPNSGEVTDALEKGLIDVSFIPVDDQRKKRVDFGPAYFQFESTCLVLGSSDFKTNSDLDRPGVRVAGEANSTTIRAAEHILKSATIIAVPSVEEAVEMLRSGHVDAFALGRDSLAPYQAEIPGSRRQNEPLKPHTPPVFCLGAFLFSRLGDGRPAIDDIVQLPPFAMPAQLAQSVVGDPHPIIFSQTKAAAG